MSTIKVALCSTRPDSGKTTLAVNLGAALARRGKNVLIVDGDPSNPFANMTGLSESGVVLDRAATQVLRSTPQDGLSVLCGFGVSVNSGRGGDSAEKLRKVYEEYDWVIFDCCTENGPVLREMLRLADSVVIPVQHDEESYQALPETLKAVLAAQKVHTRLRVAGLLVTMAPASNTAEATERARATYKAIIQKYASLLFKAEIPFDRNVAGAMEELAPVVLKQPSASAVAIFNQVVDELEEKMGVVRSAAPASARRVAVGQDTAIQAVREPVAAMAGTSGSYAPPPAYGTQQLPPQPRKEGPVTALLGWLSGLFGKR